MGIYPQLKKNQKQLTLQGNGESSTLKYKTHQSVSQAMCDSLAPGTAHYHCHTIISGNRTVATENTTDIIWLLQRELIIKIKILPDVLSKCCWYSELWKIIFSVWLTDIYQIFIDYLYEPNAVCWPIRPTECHFF